MAWAPEYISVDELREFVRISDSIDDGVMVVAIAASSRAIDRHCRRQFGQVDEPQVRRYWARVRRGQLVANIDDLTTTAGLLVNGEAVVSPELAPLNAEVIGLAWTSLEVPDTALDDRGRVAITAQWGWPEVPFAVQQACLLQSSRLLNRRGAPYGVAGSPDAGSEIRLLAKVDPDVAVSLDFYRRKARPQ